MKALRHIQEPRKRRLIYAGTALILAALCVVPRPYVARAKLVPQDASSIGIGSMMSAVGGQLQGFAALFGGARQPIDLYLAVARGDEVAEKVVKSLDLAGPEQYGSDRKARLALMKKVDVHSLTGGVIEVETRSHSAEEAKALTEAFVAAITTRLNTLGMDRVTRKRGIVETRFKEASARVAEAEVALQTFRKTHNLAQPEAQLGSELALRANLQGQLQAKQIELQTLQQFQGPENPQFQALQSEVASLRAQIARASSPKIGEAGPNLAGLSEVSGKYLDLYRDYRFSQALYEVYSRSSEEVAVETLTAETASDAQVIEASRLDVDRKFNIPAVALLALVMVLAFFTEIYAPATGMRLPLIGRDEERE